MQVQVVDMRSLSAKPAATRPLVGIEPLELTTPSASAPDWSRERCGPFEWHPSRQLLRALRDYQSAREQRGVVAHSRRMLAVLRHRFWTVVTGADIPLNSQLGGGLLLPHPNGVVVHPAAVVGPNCLFFQQVTVGTGPKPGLPVLGGHVDVGPGAKLLGGIKVGDHAVIGANAVVLTDIPERCVAVGVPAGVKRIVDDS